MGSSILIIGSTNTDMVVKTNHFPQPGETVLGGRFLMNPGGKGANQAVAAARLSGQVTFVTKLGDDLFGRQARTQFEQEGLGAEYVFTDPEQPSGVALITVDARGENSIVVAPGANGTLSPADVARATPAFAACALVLLQLEVPLVTVAAVAALATAHSKRLILNPAPAAPLADELLRQVFLLTPNRTEAEVLTGIAITDTASMHAATQALRAKGVANVIITLGAEGAFLCTETEARLLPSTPTTALDTTAAGDVFNGALAVALAEGEPLAAAVAFANRAAAISVTRPGAQASAPYRRELAGAAAPVPL